MHLVWQYIFLTHLPERKSMQRVRRMAIVGLAALILTVWSVPSHAEEAGFGTIFSNALYGGLSGALVGAAVMAFTKKPGDHLDYIGYGAAGGVLAGTAYGLVKTAKALAELDNGTVKLAMPTIVPDYIPAGAKGEGGMMITAELLRGKF